MDIPSTSQEPHQPVNCSDCVVGYGQFYHLYSGQFEKIVQYCQAHGVLLSGKVCPHCNSECRLDYHLKSWRCDKSVKVGHHKKKEKGVIFVFQFIKTLGLTSTLLRHKASYIVWCLIANTWRGA